MQTCTHVTVTYCINYQPLPSLKLTYPLKIDHPKRKLVFQPSIFKCYVSFREGTSPFGSNHCPTTHPPAVCLQIDDANLWQGGWDMLSGRSAPYIGDKLILPFNDGILSRWGPINLYGLGLMSLSPIIWK